VTGVLRRQLELAFEKQQSRFTARICPLDLHPQVGQQTHSSPAVLGLTSNQPFFEEKGQLIGREGRRFVAAR